MKYYDDSNPLMKVELLLSVTIVIKNFLQFLLQACTLILLMLGRRRILIKDIKNTTVSENIVGTPFIQ